MVRRQKWFGTLVAAAGVAVLLAGCGASGSGGSSAPSVAPTGSMVPASLAAAAKTDPLAPYPSRPGSLPTVVVGRSVPALSFAGLDIARAMNFFGYLGVDVKYQTLEAGSQMTQAVTGGSINLGDSASTEVAAGVAKGLPLEAVENTVMMTLQVCSSISWDRAHHVTPRSPIADRVKALKGAKIAITGPGSVSDTIARWLLKTYGSLDPDRDASLIQVGGAAGFGPALSENRIQAFILSSPNCQIAKGAEVLIQPTEIPQFKDYTHEVLYTTKTWAADHRDLTTKVATAVGMGDNFVLKHPAQSLAILQKLYPAVAPDVVKAAFEQNILPNIRANGQFTPAMWQSTSDVLTKGQFISKPLDTAPNVIWSNNYINVAAAQVY
jgi:NitT/TauT family transport system substrate-binding protein